MNIFSSIKSALSNANNDLAKHRAVIVALRSELEAAKATPLDLAEATARLDAWIARQADRAPMGAFLDADDNTPAPGIYFEDVDPLRLVFQLCGKEAVRKHLHGQLIADAKERGKGMSAEVRRAKIESIERRLLEAEVQIEALLCEFESNGFPIQRDPNADVRAVLGLV